MTIKRYDQADQAALFELLREQGEEWSDYHSETGTVKYLKALATSVVYVAYDDENTLCGYTRCRDDDGFGLYVYDLLVKQSHRGKQLGKLLMAQACKDYPDQPVYVTSDVDPYYEKLGYQRVGSIFQVQG